MLPLQLYAVALGEQLDRLLEREALGRLDEPDRIARLATAEAVVELVLGVDRERGCALVVEGAEAGIARAHAPQVRAGADELQDVDGLLDALDRVLRVKRHRWPSG